MLIRADLNFCVPGYPTTKERTFHRSEFLAEGTDLTLCTAGTSARGLKSAITRTSEENGQHQDWRFAGVAPQQQTANRLFSSFFKNSFDSSGLHPALNSSVFLSAGGQETYPGVKGGLPQLGQACE